MKKIYLTIPFLAFVIDRIIKKIAPSISVGGDFLSFGFYKNYAGAFSLPLAGNLYNAAGVILLVIFGYFFYVSLRARSKAEGVAILPLNEIASSPTPRNDRIAYLFILLGGLSNMFDRLAYGYTIDYINFFDFSFFNIADGMLVLGIIILFFCNLKQKKKIIQ